MVTPKQYSFLNALGIFKFLSRLQMARLGIEKYNSAFSRYCKPLHDAKYIGLLDASNYGMGYIYYLTKKGAYFLSKESGNDLSGIHFCLNAPKLSTQTLFHRNNAIDCQIELFSTCSQRDIKILFYDREIETLGSIKKDNNLIRKTRLNLGYKKYLEPDAIFMLDTPKGKKLYCLEYEEKDHTQKSFAKLQKHIQALNIKSPSQRYKHDRAHRVLFVYHNPATMVAVMDKAKKSISSIGDWVLFKTYDNVRNKGKFEKATYVLGAENNFFEDWINVEKQVNSMF